MNVGELAIRKVLSEDRERHAAIIDDEDDQ